MSMTVVEVLEKGGWIQGRYTGSGETHCLVGAVEATCGILEYSTYECGRLRQALDIVEPNWRYEFGSVEAWNDHHSRTIEDVMLVAKHYDHLTAEGDDE